MIKYIWEVTKLHVAGPDNTVNQIDWKIHAVEGDTVSPTIPKHTRIPGPSSDTFIAYENISQEQALEWLFNAMSLDEKNWWEENCRINIEKQKNPPTSLGLPWESTT